MVISIPFQWRQTDTLIIIDISAESLTVFFSPLYLKINHTKTKRFLGIDLAHSIHFQRSTSLELNGHTFLTLFKVEPVSWPQLSSLIDKQSLSQRRADSISQGEKALQILAIKNEENRNAVAKTNDYFLLKLSEKAGLEKETQLKIDKKVASRKLLADNPQSTTHAHVMEHAYIQPVRTNGGTIQVKMTPTSFGRQPARNPNPHLSETTDYF